MKDVHKPSISTGWLSVISNFSSDELSSSKSLSLFYVKDHSKLNANSSTGVERHQSWKTTFPKSLIIHQVKQGKSQP